LGQAGILLGGLGYADYVQLNSGYLPQRYTREATDRYQAQPVESFPIMLQDIPAQTAALAVSLIDYDAVPRTGFPFIHWLAANIPVMTELRRTLVGNLPVRRGKRRGCHAFTSWTILISRSITPGLIHQTSRILHLDGLGP
jgi:Phospholipid-binding protein